MAVAASVLDADEARNVAETKRVDGRRYGALARALLKARTAAERDAILADHQAHMHCA